MKKLLPLCSGVAVCAVFGGAFGATNPQITKLMHEKQQKMQQLEQCAKKVTGFKIAGISTLGLTAVGIGGNVALAVKQKGLNTQIEKVQTDLDAERATLSKLEKEIATKTATTNVINVGVGGDTVVTGGDGVVTGVAFAGKIGDVCNAAQVKDSKVANAVLKETGSIVPGGFMCNNESGASVPCACSATECVGGSPLLALNGGISGCSLPAANNDAGTGTGGNANTVVTPSGTNGRVMGALCSRSDIEETTKYWGVASKTLEAKYMAVNSDYGMVCKDDSNEFGGETYCLCGATKCDPNGSKLNSEGLPSCDSTNEKPELPMLAERVLGRECSKTDVEFTNRIFANENADAGRTRSARYKAIGRDYGMLCEETAGSKEKVFCLCEATDCESDARTTHDEGLKLCLSPFSKMQANAVKPLENQSYTPLALQNQGSSNGINWRVIERADQAYGISEAEFCEISKGRDFGGDVNIPHFDRNNLDLRIKHLAGLGYWCKRKGGNWVEKDKSIHWWWCESLPQTSCSKPESKTAASNSGSRRGSGSSLTALDFNNPGVTVNAAMNLQKNMMAPIDILASRGK